MNHNLSKALQEFVPKVMILFAFLSQTLAIERDRSRVGNSVRVKLPVIWRYEPRPAQHLPDAYRLDHDRLALRRENFQRYIAFAYQVKGVRGLALFEDVRVFREAHIGRAAKDQIHELLIEAREKWVLFDYAFKCLNCCLLLA